MTCKDAMAALVASIETGHSLTEDVREHLRTCASCRALLASTRDVESALTSEQVREPSVDENQFQDTVRRTSRKQFLVRGAIVLGLAIVFAGLLGFLVAIGEDDLNWRDGVYVFGLASLIAAAPALLFYVLIAVLHDRRGNRIYKRLKEGRLVSGVCLGLAESTGVPLQILRIAFVLLIFAKGIGIWLYIVLDLAMPVHPDDRVHLLRFRIRRWFQRRFARDANANAR